MSKLFDGSEVSTPTTVAILRKEVRRLTDLFAAAEHAERLEGQLATMQAGIDLAQSKADERLRATEAAITRTQQAAAEAEGASNETKAARAAELEKLNGEIADRVKRLSVLERKLNDAEARAEEIRAKFSA